MPEGQLSDQGFRKNFRNFQVFHRTLYLLFLQNAAHIFTTISAHTESIVCLEMLTRNYFSGSISGFSIEPQKLLNFEFNTDPVPDPAFPSNDSGSGSSFLN